MNSRGQLLWSWAKKIIIAAGSGNPRRKGEWYAVIFDRAQFSYRSDAAALIIKHYMQIYDGSIIKFTDQGSRKYVGHR